MEKRAISWIVDSLAGGLIGLVVGLIVAANIAIARGIESGYEATIADAFREDTFTGALMVSVLVAGPVTGVILARWIRRRAMPHTD